VLTTAEVNPTYRPVVLDQARHDVNAARLGVMTHLFCIRAS